MNTLEKRIASLEQQTHTATGDQVVVMYRPAEGGGIAMRISLLLTVEEAEKLRKESLQDRWVERLATFAKEDNVCAL